MLRIAICDDDQLFVEQLVNYLEEFFKRNQISCPEIISFSDGNSLLKNEQQIDIVFLDIEMPGLSGITTGAELKRRNKNIIIFIITSYVEYLDEAMRFQVFRYLTKPLEKQRLFRNLKDALHVYSILSTKIAIKTKQGIYTVHSSDIVFIESVNKKTIVHTTKKDYVSVLAVSEWLKYLPNNCFFQSHRSFIVNFAYISDFDHTLIHLCERKFSAYLTRRKYTAFKASYLLYLESVR